MNKLVLPLLLLASPLAAQLPDTVRTHPDDTIKIVVPDTGLYHMDMTRREGSMTLIRHILVISVPKSTPIDTAQPPITPPSGSFAAPDIVVNSSFETDWEGFNNGGSGAPTGVVRDGAHARDGAWAVRRTLSTGAENGAAFYAQFYDPIFSHFGDKSAQRVWVRFYFFIDRAFDGILKLEQFYRSSDDNYGGWYFNGGNLSWCFSEALYNGGTIYDLVPLAGLLNGWHSIEVDFWHNGDTSNGGSDYPSAAFWLDGQPITSGIGNPTGGTVWLNGRLNAGRRQYNGDLGNTNLIGIKNAGNSVAATMWVDRIAISTKGRIGS
jgi:hypothetical protein